MNDQAKNDKAADDTQGASARPGGEAAGGIDHAPSDPADPADGAGSGDRARREMRQRGFGDHKGAEQ